MTRAHRLRLASNGIDPQAVNGALARSHRLEIRDSPRSPSKTINLRAALWPLVLLLFFSAPARALTLQEVIALARAGYDDQSLVMLIEDTGSVFRLAAEDLVELNEAGVSDRVMQAMIQSGAAPESLPTAASAHEEPDSGSPLEPAPPEPEHTEPEHAEPDFQDRRQGRPLQWSSYAFHEDAHAGGHEHAVVAYGDIDVLVLRAEAGFSSVESRAAAVAARLGAAFDDRLSSFEARSTEKSTFGIFRVSSADPREEEILRVSRADVVAFANRSGRDVDAEILARWWALLLRDYHRVLARNQAPREVSELHVGEALVALYQQARSASGGDVTSSAMLEAMRSLTKTQREHFTEMAGLVPRDFEPDDSH